MAGIRATGADPPEKVGLVRARVHAVIVKHFADRNAAIEQRFAGGLEVRDDQVQALRGAGSRNADILAKDHRAPGARRRELDHAEVVAGCKIGVQPPPKLGVKLFRAVHIRDGYHDDFELHVHWRDAGLDTTDCIGAHDSLLCCVLSLFCNWPEWPGERVQFGDTGQRPSYPDAPGAPTQSTSQRELAGARSLTLALPDTLVNFNGSLLDPCTWSKAALRSSSSRFASVAVRPLDCVLRGTFA